MKPFVVILLGILLFACSESIVDVDAPLEPDYVMCDSSCYSVNLVGKVINLSSNEGVVDVPIILQWCNYDFMHFGHVNYIDVITTDADGYFELTNEIDSSLFSNDYYMNLSTYKQSEYYTHFISYDIPSVDDCNNDSIDIYFIEKINLTVSIEKDTSVVDSLITDTVSYLYLQGHYFYEDEISPVRTIYFKPSYVDSTNVFNGGKPMEKSFKAAVGIPTILTYKIGVNGEYTTYVDTLIFDGKDDMSLTLKY